jgi:hypothetical protein
MIFMLGMLTLTRPRGSGILKVAPTLLSGYVENRLAEEALKQLAADGGAGASQRSPARR